MGRCTIAEVEEIIQTDESDATIQACIDVANLIVTAGPAASSTPALGAAHLKEIERWLSAHFVAIKDPVSLRSVIGDSESWAFPASVTVAWGKGLNLTPYGQQAIAIDLTGELAKLGQKRGSFRAGPREDGSRFSKGLTK